MAIKFIVKIKILLHRCSFYLLHYIRKPKFAITIFVLVYRLFCFSNTDETAFNSHFVSIHTPPSKAHKLALFSKRRGFCVLFASAIKWQLISLQAKSMMKTTEPIITNAIKLCRFPFQIDSICHEINVLSIRCCI